MSDELKSMTDELKKRLIVAVFEKRPIWDQEHAEHHNRFKLEKMWIEVGKKCGMTNRDAKKKWKSLRQQFKAKWDKLPSATPENPTPEDSEDWPFFKSMLFLCENFNKNRAAGHFILPDDGNDASNETFCKYEEDGDQTNASTSFSLATAVVTPYSPPYENSPSPAPSTSGEYSGSRKRLRRTTDPNGMEMVEFERLKKVRELDKKDDEDAAFFTSLLPHVKRMHPVTKLKFRIEVEKLVIEMAYGEGGSVDNVDENLGT